MITAVAFLFDCLRAWTAARMSRSREAGATRRGVWGPNHQSGRRYRPPLVSRPDRAGKSTKKS